MTRRECLDLLKNYLDSGDARMDFDYGSEPSRHEVLDILEQMIELGEAADALATALIFKDSYLEMLTGVPKEASPDLNDQTKRDVDAPESGDA